MISITSLPVELLQCVTSHLSLRDKLRLRVALGNSHAFHPACVEEAHIWDKVFKKGNPWLENVLSSGMYPVLIGNDLTQLDGDCGRQLPYIALALAQPEGCHVTALDPTSLLSSLHPGCFCPIRMEVIFPDFVLHVGNALGEMDMADPRRLIRSGSSATRVIFWSGKSTSGYYAKTRTRKSHVVITSENNGLLFTWVFFTSTSEPKYRQVFGGQHRPWTLDMGDSAGRSASPVSPPQ